MMSSLRLRFLLSAASAAVLALSLHTPLAAAPSQPAQNTAPLAVGAAIDVLVYGGTPSGVIAAVAAARAGSRVTLIEPTGHVGGMMSNGLSWTDRGDTGVIGGLTREFFDRVQAREGSLRGRYAFQPATAEAVFLAMLAEAGVNVYYNQRLAEVGGVTMNGTQITAVLMESGQSYIADQFIDASYEGDLMADAGVTYRVGREASSEYGESLAGVWPASQLLASVPAGTDAGVPLAAPGPVGSADNRIQNSNFRVCLSDKVANQTPFLQPPGYSAARYDIVADYMAERALPSPPVHLVLHMDLLVNGKWDLNEFGGMTFGIPGANYDYPDGTYAQRQEIIAYHRLYQEGFLYFLVNDPRVPAAVRDEMARFGLCKDEFTDNGNWPRQLYIREGRRMVGQYVVSQRDVENLPSKPDIIGIASYHMDSHYVSRWIDGGRMFVEGGFWSPENNRWALPYRSLTPKREEATNLLVPVTVSASHVAYTSLRMEPQYMIMGEAAGVAAALADATSVAVQDVSVKQLQNALRANGAVLDDPGDIGTSSYYEHIVWAYYEGITSGCAKGLFCPNQSLTREQMAAFLVRALDLAPATQDYFSDDETSTFEANINALAASGITFGCSKDRFCPTQVVTREQMASFLVRAFLLPPTQGDYFTDDSSSSHQANINALAESGITTGCGATTFCPKAAVTRGQMLAFLHRAMDR